MNVVPLRNLSAFMVAGVIAVIPVEAQQSRIAFTCNTTYVLLHNDLPNTVEVFVRAANTNPQDYNEYQLLDPLDPDSNAIIPLTGFNSTPDPNDVTAVVALQVSMRELVQNGAVPPVVVEVAEFRCPENPPASDTLSASFEATLRSQLDSHGLIVGAWGSPIGNREGNSTGLCPGLEKSSALYKNTISTQLTGVMHGKYICTHAASVTSFDGTPTPCCNRPGTGSNLRESCCEGELDASGLEANPPGNGDDLCKGGNAPCANSSGSSSAPLGQAIESVYGLETLDQNDCVDNSIKRSIRLSCRDGVQNARYPVCCDPTDTLHLDVVTATCAGMVVTHAQEDNVLKPLRQPYWTTYAMDAERGKSLLPLKQRYISPEELMFDCFDFTIPDLQPVSGALFEGWCPEFSQHDTNNSGVHDYCEPPPCPYESACSGCEPGAVGCTPTGPTTEEALGWTECVMTDGQRLRCPGGIKLVTTECSKCACCTTIPTCICPQTCDPQRVLACQEEEM